MKISLLTNLLHKKTGHINVGDVFIRQGLQYVLEKACPEEIEWVLISRFTPLDDDKLQKIKECDLIVYGGMPQYNDLDDWCFYYDNKIWDDLQSTGVPIWRIAGGGGGQGENTTPKTYSNKLSKSKKTKDILKKSMVNCKLVTTRDKMAQQFLVDNNVESKLLPCTGTFAMLFNGVNKTDKTINAICLTASYLNQHNNRTGLINEFKRTMGFLNKKTRKPTKIICQVKKSDSEFLYKHFDKKDIIVVDEPLKILDIYKHVDICVTTRLHCALPIHGIGGRVILLRVDTRGIAGEELGIPVVKLSDYTREKFIQLYSTNGFSKIDVKSSLDKSIEFYKKSFEEILKEN